MLSVPCFNMTGPMIEPGQKAPEELTLRIDKPTRETIEQQLSGELPVPYIFIGPPHYRPCIGIPGVRPRCS
jgi:hypothetical protein